MNKRAISIVLSAIISLSQITSVFAQGTLTEKPDFKIIIDGVESKYKDVPLVDNGKILLPLREVLTRLGIPNDDNHIIWNEYEESITIYKDTTKIYLKIGSNIVYIDGAPVTLDKAPISYSKNYRTYISEQFLKLCLGKDVKSDSSSVVINTSNSEKVVALLKSIETGATEPIAYINSDKYIQHNLSAEDGLAGFG